MMLHGHVQGERSPAAAYVEHRHARLQRKLAAYHLHFGPLRLVESLRPRGLHILPAGAAVLHGGTEHGTKERRIGIVMRPRHHEGPGTALEIEQGMKRLRRPGGICMAERPFQMRAYGPAEHRIHGLAFPPPVHVGLAESQRSLLQKACIETFVEYLNIPRPVAVDANVRLFGQLFHPFLCLHDFLLFFRRVTKRKSPFHDRTVFLRTCSCRASAPKSAQRKTVSPCLPSPPGIRASDAFLLETPAVPCFNFLCLFPADDACSPFF